MKIFLGSDHGGFVLKNKIKEYLMAQKHDIEDMGCYDETPCDYPEFGVAVGKKVVETKDSFGIIFCGSGIGMSIASNKVRGIRTVLANSNELARLGREHNGANILSLGERTHFIDDPIDIVQTFLTTQVDNADRHERRRQQLNKI